MAENACFLSLLMDPRSHNTCKKEINIWKYAEQYCALIYTIYSRRNTRVRSYLDYSRLF